jgi:hypothetical protein
MNASASARDTRLLAQDILRSMLVHEPRDLSQVAIAQPPSSERPSNRSSGRPEDLLRERHSRQYVVRHGLVREEGSVARAEDGVEAFGIQIGDLDLVPGLKEAKSKAVEHGATERLSIGVCEDRQDSHRRASVDPGPSE